MPDDTKKLREEIERLSERCVNAINNERDIHAERLAFNFVVTRHQDIIAALRAVEALQLAQSKLQESETPFYEGMKIINEALASQPTPKVKA